MALDPSILAAMQGNAMPMPQPSDLTAEQLLQIIAMLRQGNGNGGQGMGAASGPPPDLAAALAGMGTQSPLLSAGGGPNVVQAGGQPPSQNQMGPISGSLGQSVAPSGAASGGLPQLPPELLAMMMGQGGGPNAMGPIQAGGPPPPDLNSITGGPPSLGGGPSAQGPIGAGAPPPPAPQPSQPPQPADVNQKTPAQVVAEDDSNLWLQALQQMTQVNASNAAQGLRTAMENPVEGLRMARSNDPGAFQSKIEQLLQMLSRKAPGGMGGGPGGSAGGPGRPAGGPG